MGVWDKGAAAWVTIGTLRILVSEAPPCLHCRDTGRSLENAVCIGVPHIAVEWCLLFLCILHSCMTIGRLQVGFTKARLLDLPSKNAKADQQVLYQAHTGVKVGAAAAPDGEEARVLFIVWEKLGLLLDYLPEDGECKAVVDMRDLLRELHQEAAKGQALSRGHCAGLPLALLQRRWLVQLTPIP